MAASAFASFLFPHILSGWNDPTGISQESLPTSCVNVIHRYFMISSPDCTLHTSIISHVIAVLEQQSLMLYIVGIHVRFYHSNTIITCVIAVSNAQWPRTGNCEWVVNLVLAVNRASTAG